MLINHFYFSDAISKLTKANQDLRDKVKYLEDVVQKTVDNVIEQQKLKATKEKVTEVNKIFEEKERATDPLLKQKVE